MYCSNPECPDTLATGKPGEYVEGIEICPICGAELVQSPPAISDQPDYPSSHSPLPQPDEALEPVFECSDPSEVLIVKSLLESEGIRFITAGEEQFDAFRGSLSPFRLNPRAGVIRFLVPMGQAETARDLLVELEDEE